MRCLVVPGSSTESVLTAGLSLPRSAAEETMIAVAIRCFPNPQGEVSMVVQNGVGNEIWRDSVNPGTTTPHLLCWSVGGSPYAVTRRSGDVITHRPMPRLVLDATMKVLWQVLQSVGNVGSITDVVVMLEGSGTPGSIAPKPAPAPGGRARRSFPDALRGVVASHNRTPADAVRVLGGTTSPAGQLAQGGGLVRGKLGKGGGFQGGKLAQGGGLVRGKAGKGGGFAR